MSLEIVKTLKAGASLKWAPPASDGGAPITNYVLEHRIEGGVKWVRATDDKCPDTAFTVKGLKPDMLYEFRVCAENKAGVGPASDPTSPVKIIEQISTSTPTDVIFFTFSIIINGPVNATGNAIASVRPSVRLFPLYLRNRHTVDLEHLRASRS